VTFNIIEEKPSICTPPPLESLKDWPNGCSLYQFISAQPNNLPSIDTKKILHVTDFLFQTFLIGTTSFISGQY